MRRSPGVFDVFGFRLGLLVGQSDLMAMMRIPSKDLEASEDFYTEQLKLNKIFGSEAEGFIGYQLDNIQLMLEPEDKGEQLLFKAITYNQWLLVGRKTYESMGALLCRT